MKVSRILIVSIFVSMLVLPLAAMNAVTPSVDLKAPIESHSIPSQVTDLNQLGAFEGIVTQIDPTGGVRNAIGTFQNASYYEVGYTTAYQTVVENQMATDDGYVSFAQLEVAGRSIYPTGRVGGAAAALTVMISPIVVLPTNPADLNLRVPTLVEAQILADEIVALYEADLGIEFERLTTAKLPTWVYYNYEATYYIDQQADFFYIQFISMPDASDGSAALSAMQSRFSGLGGFMDLMEGSSWPVDRTDFAETLLFDHVSEQNWFYSDAMNPLYITNNLMRPHVRADVSHTAYVESVNTGVLAMAGFDVPNHLNDGTGTETYSLKQHVGYIGDIESKMFQDQSINSISTVVAVTPSLLEIDGVSEYWDYVDKDFTFNSPGSIGLPTGQTIPGDSTAEEIIQAMMVSFPQIYAMQLNQEIGYWDTNMFDSLIDSLWASPGPFPDLREYFLEFDWSMVFTTYPVEELNQDALRLIMDEMGINPDSLFDTIDETMLENDPMRALVEAFIRSLDSYHLLDILVNTTYTNPLTLEGYINEYITNIESFLTNVTGVSLPSSYETKEAFAALIEDHFGLVLQGLWDAMAAFVGDTTSIKAAVQAMVDPTHLADETVPYFWADLYSSVVTEYDYGMYINFEMPVYTGSPEPYDPPLLWLTTEDIVLTFNLDISSLAFDGPHLTITKSIPQQMTIGTAATVTITVENLGDATAYDLKILDGISAGFDVEKQYYWNVPTLAAGGTWTETFQITPEEAGTFAVIPAILCYFNVSLDTFDSTDILNWDGAAMYTASAIGGDIRVTAGFEVSMIMIIAGAAGVVIIVVVIAIIKKKK
ncbi:MAG: CARDB domain-containing protein [Candidatus Thorarchaeota archaeon]